MTTEYDSMSVSVVIPAYRVRRHILGVIDRIPAFIRTIYVVDDACPESSGDFVNASCDDRRVVVLRNLVNLGVGGAVMTGYSRALVDGADIVVKIDGDGQMDPSLIHSFVTPIMAGRADYTKGNRFFDMRALHRMPLMRLIGNAGLSFLSKLSTGYWQIFDPTNGYTAIHRTALVHLPLDRVSKRYFFETDMLFRLNTLRAVVRDVPMDAIYGDEESNLKIGRILPEFLLRHSVIFSKRIFYNYFLRDFSIASIELLLGIACLTFGAIFGAREWAQSLSSGIPSTAGIVMIGALPIIIGLQLVLAFISYDVSATPREPLIRT